MEFYDSTIPDMLLVDTLSQNPKLYSKNEEYTINFLFTKDDKFDFEEYNELLTYAIKNFRTSKTYKHYKSYLYSIGINACAFHPHIKVENGLEAASLEMHHCMLNIFDIATLITEHCLNNYVGVTEFDIADLLAYEHKNNNIPIVMLCKDCHNKYHHNYLYVEPSQIFGNYIELLYRYPDGWNITLLEKVCRYLDRSLGDRLEYQIKNRDKLLKLRDDIYDWSSMRNITLELEEYNDA